MSQFYGVFFEEASELLAEMENLLLQLDPDAPDSEKLNAIFRAAHSIKGGASTFGFTDMTEVTHILESMLDKVRKGELTLTDEMVDASLKAGDILKSQMAGHRDQSATDPEAAAAICAVLKRLADAQSRAPTPAPVVAQTPEPPATVAAPTQKAGPASGSAPVVYRIEFSVAGSARANKAMLDNIFADLRSKGKLDVLTEPADGDVEPAVFALQLATAASEEDVWEVLAFVIDPAALKIETLSAEGATVPAPAAKADPGYGFFEPLYDALVPQGSAEKPAPAATSVAAAKVPDADPEKDDVPRPQMPARPEAVPPGRRESDKASAASANADSSSIRVNIEKVDLLINLVGELVIAQAMLAQTASKIDPVTGESLLQGMNQLERNVRDLQEAVMSIRMMPIGFVFSRFPRVVRDLAGKLKKEVELKTVGEGTELDRGLIEKISDPLTHLVRNSLDHGIELPEKRIAAGKPARGTITLRAFHQGGNIVIEVGDDGAGLSREKILSKARSRGMPVPDSMTDQEVWQLIFEAGFSTAEVVTDVSGRGVGMDVVKRNIQALGGSVDIDSALGVGTRMSIRLPLTLAILDGMSVSVGNQTFIVPLISIVESLQPRREDIKGVQGRDALVHVRGDYLPVVALHEVFGIQPRETDMGKGIMMILEAEGTKKALFVDELLGQHQVVIKSLQSNYKKVPGVSGATIMGDGRVALILDVAAIVRGGSSRMLEAA